ncbi:uncharacterized protein [Venturia canescens]|uniref:uncharacterized protein n=1 Tax=Venturia canescens TaxID=32260 RepID=UPI001C9C0527|nr:uncharacterized protein LOC122415339 [Venturia canescens]
MVISNIRLPQIELPKDEILDDEDKKVLEALDTILNGFKNAQKRTRTIKKAFIELESITVSLLQKFEDEETFPKNEANKVLSNRNPICKSTISKLHDDLIRPGQSNDKQKQLDHEFPRKSCENLEMEVNASISGIPKVAKKQNISTEDEIGNEENTPPFIDESPTYNDLSIHSNEAKAIKISLAKTIFTPEIQKHRKTPKSKSLKQATLVFQPVVTKTDLTLSQKKGTRNPNVAHNSSNLFDEDYRTKKKASDRATGHSKKTELVDLTTQNEQLTSTPNAKEVKVDPLNEKVGINASKKSDSIIVIPTASQIDETARSLFDDEDHDNFVVSPDILDTCTDFTAFNNSVKNDGKKNFDGIEKSDSVAAGTSKALQRDSFDETFFAPAEMNVLGSDAKEKPLLAGCSKITSPRETPNKVRPFKRKSHEEPSGDSADDFEDLALQDVNWDIEISNDSWVSSKNPHESFHIPPQKTKKSPQYAHRGNTERNMAKRSKLRGWDCPQCEKYYQNMDLSESQMEKRKNACSRHRSKFNPRYFTPKGFWNPEFSPAPDSSDFSDD